jgi:hypothetical protein
MRAAFLAIALVIVFVAFAPAQKNRTIEISGNSFAAIAYSPSTGKYAYACDLRSRKAAEKEAVEKCGAPDATVACWVNKGFCALALGEDKSCWGVGWSYGGGSSNDAAKDYALDDCRKRTTGVHIAVVLSSDGQYIWDRRDNMTVIDKNGNVFDGYGRPITPSPSPSGSASPEKK